VCLGNESSGCARRRRSGARCWLDQEPVRRGGDRQLSRALHTIVLHRRQHDAATRDYIAHHVAQGKSTRDATRMLKRYLARHLYRVMQNAEPTMT
jgi:GrpB-like predicted nucleotidyltransferase (UPF0157 family)